MKQCPNCEAMLADDAKFCSHCGAVVEVIREGAIAMLCSNCGAELTGKFCDQCGTPVTHKNLMPESDAKTVAMDAANKSAPRKKPKKTKKKPGLIVVAIAGVLVLALGVCWAFGLFGDGLLDEKSELNSAASGNNQEEEHETKVIPIVVYHPTLGMVIEGYTEVDIADERTHIEKNYDDTKMIPVIVHYPGVGNVIEGYEEVKLLDKRDYIYKEYGQDGEEP